MAAQLLVRGSRTFVLDVPADAAELTTAWVHEQLLYKEHASVCQDDTCADAVGMVQPRFLLLSGGKVLEDVFDPAAHPVLQAVLAGALPGGKGGFGSNLKSSGRQSVNRKPPNFSLCRDLSGRRLKVVNDEARLQRWLAPEEAEKRKKLGSEYEEARGAAGLQGWFLGVPSWAEGVKGARGGGAAAAAAVDAARARRKTALCRDWLEARAGGRRIPDGAPPWYGCPRGRRCEFAHGEGDMRQAQRDLAAAVAKAAAAEEAQRGKDAYTAGIYLYDEGEADADAGSAAASASGGGSSASGGVGGDGGLSRGRSMLSTVLAGLGSEVAAAGRKRVRDVSDITGDNADDQDGVDDDEEEELLPIDGWLKGKGKSNGGSGSTQAAKKRKLESEDSIGGSGGSSSIYTTAGGSAGPAEVPAVAPSVAAAPAGYDAGHWCVCITPATTAEDVPVQVAYTPATGGGSSGSSGSSTAGVALVEASLAFATVAVPGLRLSLPPAATHTAAAAWYYEVALLSADGVTQIGWATPDFPVASTTSSSSASSSGSAASSSASSSSAAAASGQQTEANQADADAEGADGVGDDAASWSYDGVRCLAWHPYSSGSSNSGGSSSSSSSVTYPAVTYGRPWAAGDIVGVTLALQCTPTDSNSVSISMRYSLNGEDMGAAFTFTQGVTSHGSSSRSSCVFVPAVSLDEGEAIALNCGGAPFAYPPAALPADSVAGGLVPLPALAARGAAAVYPLPQPLPQPQPQPQQLQLQLQAPAATITSGANASGAGAVAAKSASAGSAAVTVPVPASAPAPAPAPVAAPVPSPVPAVPAAHAPAAAPPPDLEQWLLTSSAAVWTEVGLCAAGITGDQLKQACVERGLKSGGTYGERAARLLAVAVPPPGLSPAQVPKQLRGTGFPGPRLRPE